jgi:hypothetical protein
MVKEGDGQLLLEATHDTELFYSFLEDVEN